MPYWTNAEMRYDRNGVEIKPGDVLKNIDPSSPWQHFVCYDDGLNVMVRDLNGNNVCMCDLGPKGDVINLGHYTKNPGILSEEDIEYYFGKEPTHE